MSEKTVRQVLNQLKPIDETLVASATQTTTGNGSDYDTEGIKDAVVFLNISAASGTTPTLDVKIQGKDPVSAAYKDLCAFTQKTTTGTAIIVLGTGAANTAETDDAWENPLPKKIRAAWTIGGTTPSFTFSLGITGKS